MDKAIEVSTLKVTFLGAFQAILGVFLGSFAYLIFRSLLFLGSFYPWVVRGNSDVLNQSIGPLIFIDLLFRFVITIQYLFFPMIMFGSLTGAILYREDILKRIPQKAQLLVAAVIGFLIGFVLVIHDANVSHLYTKSEYAIPVAVIGAFAGMWAVFQIQMYITKKRSGDAQ